MKKFTFYHYLIGLILLILGGLSLNFFCVYAAEEAVSISATVESAGGGGGGGGYTPPQETKVILQGKAYPSSYLTVLQDGKIVTIATADSQANFKIEITDIAAGGVWTFGIWAEDKKGRKSITFNFTVFVTKGMTTTISGIFLPPTIELSKVNLQKGETLNIYGQTAPQSEISISVESSEIVKKTTATEEGDWSHSFSTTTLDDGSHTARAKAISLEGLLSSYSKVLSFYIGEGMPEIVCPNADLNGDGKVNLVDFSILLFWWGKYNPCPDQNQDSKVNLVDFSIMMYHWTG